MLTLFFAAVIGYFVGSVPFGLVLTRCAGLGDIRKIGSGNIGATNVLRTGRKDLAAATVLLDMGKAGLVALLFKFLFNDECIGLVAGTAAVIGHNFPVWLRFKGGKGVASTLGLMLLMSPSVGICAVLTWLVMAFSFKYSSLSALVALSFAPLYALIFDYQTASMFYTGLALLSLYRHKSNIYRLLRGEESKINLRKHK